MQVTFANEKDKENIRKLWQICFDDIEPFVDYYFKYKYNHKNTLVVKKDKQVLSMTHLNPYPLALNSTISETSYVVGVATHPKEQGRGHMRKVIEYGLREMYQKGEIISILMPIDSRIYTRFGYEFIEDHFNYELDISSLPQKKCPVRNVKIGLTDIDLLDCYYNKRMKQFSMYIRRDLAYYKTLLKEIHAENGEIIGFIQDNNMVGYMIGYYYENTFEVRELFYDEIDVLEAIIAYIKAITKKEDTVTINTHKKDLLRYILPNIKKNKNELKPFMMARIINVEEMLRAASRNETVHFTLKVLDNFIKENNHTFDIDASDKGCTITKVNQNPDIIIDIGALTQYLTGYLELEELIQLKRIEYSNLSALNQLARFKLKNGVFFNEFV